MTPEDSAKTAVTMRFPVENCKCKVMVSDSLSTFENMIIIIIFANISILPYVVSYQIW